MFDESEHPRGQPDNKGQFVEKDGGSRESYTQSVNDRIKWARESGVDLPLYADGSVDDLKLQELYEKDKSDKIALPKQEYAVLRKEVMRKNAEQKGKIKPTNFAYTSNKFYVYTTKGDDDFTPLVQLDIEEEGATIDFYEKILRGKK